MKKYGINIDKEKFCNYLASAFPWFGDTIDDVYPEMKKEDEPLKYRRIDHILSDIDIDGNKIVLNIQDGDKFSDGIKVALPTMNTALMRKEDKRYFVINNVDYI
jgi:hypothetical protein